MNEFTIRIMEADAPVYSGNCISLVIPTTEGMYGIQAHHSNLFAALSTGIMKLTMADGAERYLSVSGGMVKVENGEVLILADSVEHAGEIDELRAEKEYSEAKQLLKTASTVAETRNAEAMMSRAINRIILKKRYGEYK